MIAANRKFVNWMWRKARVQKKSKLNNQFEWNRGARDAEVIFIWGSFPMRIIHGCWITYHISLLLLFLSSSMDQKYYSVQIYSITSQNSEARKNQQLPNEQWFGRDQFKFYTPVHVHSQSVQSENYTFSPPSAPSLSSPIPLIVPNVRCPFKSIFICMHCQAAVVMAICVFLSNGRDQRPHSGHWKSEAMGMKLAYAQWCISVSNTHASWCKYRWTPQVAFNIYIKPEFRVFM